MLQDRNVLTIALGLLGAAKLVLDSFGVHIISDAQVNDIANGVASLVTVAGVYMTHTKAAPSQGGHKESDSNDGQADGQ